MVCSDDIASTGIEWLKYNDDLGVSQIAVVGFYHIQDIKQFPYNTGPGHTRVRHLPIVSAACSAYMDHWEIVNSE